MARARNIKPSFFQNDALGELPAMARLLFIGMWTIADFKGCLEYRPKRMKAQLLPYDDCDVEELTNNLDKSRFISIYSVQGQRYIKITNFEKHQNPHKNEREGGSDIPDISEKDCEINELYKDGKNREQDGTTRADSLFLIPDSLNRIPDSGTPKPESACDGASPPVAAVAVIAKTKSPKEPAPTHAIWQAYARAYENRYRAEPVRNAKVNGQLASLLGRLGAEEAPAVAAFYVGHSNRYYVQKMHSVDCLLADAEKLRTEWATGNRITSAAAQEADRLQDAGDMWSRIMSEHESQGR